MDSNNFFQLLWKSRYSVRKDTIDSVLKDIHDEIRYLSTVVVPRAKGRALKSTLSKIEMLRDRRDGLEKKQVEWSKEEKTYDEGRNPRPVRDIMPPPLETDEATTEEKTYGLHTGRIEFGLSQNVKKSISLDKRQLLKELYFKAWGTTIGLDDNFISKMSSEEVDDAILSLKSLFK